MLTKDMIMQELSHLEALRRIYETGYIYWDEKAEAVQDTIHDDEAMLTISRNNNEIACRLDREYMVLEAYINAMHEYGDRIEALDHKVDLLTKLVDEYE